MCLLLVEDDCDTRTTMAGLLSEFGYSVCEAADVPGALEKMRSLQPDLVLLDYGLPGPQGGEDFLRAKASEKESRSIPVVVISGYDLPLELDGTVAVFQKPFDLDRLLGMIQRIVGPPEKPNTHAAA